ncbi:hypothetical protein [Rhizobium rhizogenes]|uniref:hypothetical protein n=1 Tax=Rhizobium rhizogenes TaxID=359 RepID=UPI0015733CB4|nr:hypothetical protein [Rhizobium rhizogenes]NTG09264.1 hypothetical protein [Rhizobium rhizogenes]
MVRRPAPSRGMNRVSDSAPWKAMIGGWRTDVTIADMPKDAAYQLDNFFPESNRIRARYGSTLWATGMGSTVQTIIPYSGATNKLFAAAGSNIYDISGTGVASLVLAGQIGSRWSVQQYTNAGGSFLRLVNGLDPPLLYDGTTWTTTAITGTGLTSSNLSVVVAYRSRLWFIEKNTTKIWYLATDAVSGAATSFPVGGSMKYGGVLVAMGVWSIPVQTGITQCLVLISSEGEVIVYQGSDPTTASGFTLLGTFKLGKPLGYDRCLLNVGADLAIMTTDGIIPITKAVQLDRGATDLGSITAKIAPTWLQTLTDVGTSSDQWQLLGFPRRRMAIVNLPDTAGPTQYVMNTETGAWCRFIGLPSTCWGTWQDRVFFGTAIGNVVEAEVGSNDTGNPIDCLAVGAWQTFGDGISPKYATMIGANLQSGTSTNFYLGVSVDYSVSIPQALANLLPTSNPAKWDVSLWDQSYFVGTNTGRKDATAVAVGVALAPVIRAQISGDSSTISEAGVVGGTILFQKGQPV